MCYTKCKEKHEKRAKALHLEAGMYRYSNGQISLSDFKQPVGMNLKESNRWVKKAQTIPWTEIEKRYAALSASASRLFAQLCEERPESRWSSARSWTSAS